MESKNGTISVNELHMDLIASNFSNCAKEVESVANETEKMRQIMEEGYKGYATEGLNDFFQVLQKHLEVLKMCYEQLGDYTTTTKMLSLKVDEHMSSNLFPGAEIKLEK